MAFVERLSETRSELPNVERRSREPLRERLELGGCEPGPSKATPQGEGDDHEYLIGKVDCEGRLSGDQPQVLVEFLIMDTLVELAVDFADLWAVRCSGPIGRRPTSQPPLEGRVPKES
jgi:hypothetical protein